jgi:LysR family transcriptional regulator, benzoate and cis,cis-muconate-responsive activator of ben and cat genes
MKLVRLRYFVAVAKELNFTRAAAKLRVAQPALSRQIRTLENEVGVELLVRDGRTLKLTPAGEVLSEEASIILAHYALATQRARDTANRDSIVRVGIGFGLAEHVDRVVTRYTGSFGDVHVQLQNIPSTLQNLALKKCEIDIGFLRPPVDAGYLSCQLLFEERLSALVPAVSPFTRYKAVRLSQLANIPLLLHPRSLSSGLYDRILDLYRVRGIPLAQVHTPHSGPGEEAGHMLVASKKGIYIVYASLAIFPVFTKRVKVLPLDEPDARIPVYVAWRNNEKSRRVLDFLRTVRGIFEINDV